MSFSALINTWSNTSAKAKVVIVTDIERLSLASEIQQEITNCTILNIDGGDEFYTNLISLEKEDLVIVLLSVHSFIQKGLNRFFSPFYKPKVLKAKYIFIRLGISKESLLEGLSTDISLTQNTAEVLKSIPDESKLLITSPSGTEITLSINRFLACNYFADIDGQAAFLPASEVNAGILEGSANGRIVVDVTVGQLYEYGRCLGEFGLVGEPVTLIVNNSEITEILGGRMAAELKIRLFSQDHRCRVLVEFGHGLSKMKPTGIIGVDESILDTCHFGIGNGVSYGIKNEAPIHLDVVVRRPTIQVLEINNT